METGFLIKIFFVFLVIRGKLLTIKVGSRICFVDHLLQFELKRHNIFILTDKRAGSANKMSMILILTFTVQKEMEELGTTDALCLGLSEVFVCKVRLLPGCILT